MPKNNTSYKLFLNVLVLNNNFYMLNNWNDESKNKKEQDLILGYGKRKNDIKYSELFGINLKRGLKNWNKTEKSNEDLFIELLKSFNLLKDKDKKLQISYQCFILSKKFFKNNSSDIDNCVIVAKNDNVSDDWKWRTNSVSLFFSINESKRKKEFRINRIEFNNVYYFENESNVFFNLKEVTFVEENDKSDELRVNNDNFLNKLNNMTRVIDYKNSNRENDVIDFHFYNDLFYFLCQIFNNDKTLEDKIINYSLNDFQESESNLINKFDYFLWITTNSTIKNGMQKNEFNLSPSDSSGENWKIKLDIKEKINDFKFDSSPVFKEEFKVQNECNSSIKDCNEKIKTLEKKNEEISVSIKTNEDRKEKLKDQFNNDKELIRFNNNIEYINNHNHLINSNIFDDFKRIFENVDDLQCYIEDYNKDYNLFKEQNKKDAEELENIEKTLDKTTAKEELKIRESELLKKEQEIKNNIEKFKVKYELIIENFLKQCEKAKNDKEDLIRFEIEKLSNTINDLNNTIKKNDEEILDLENKITEKNKSLRYINRIKNNKLKLFRDKNVYKVKISHSNNYKKASLKNNEEDMRIKSGDYIKLKALISSRDFLNINLYDIGFIKKVYRFFNSLNKAVYGYYRNPYSIYSLIKPSVIPEDRFKEFNLENNVLTKYKLNKKQEECVKKAILTRDLFYLQGPPGTGKTQCISAIIETSLKNNENVLITSSTHEAINNCLDRIDNFNQDNPNFVLFKNQSKFVTRENEYDANSLYKKFIKKSFNYILNKNTEIIKFDELEKILKSLIKKIKDKPKSKRREFVFKKIYKGFKKIKNYMIFNIVKYNERYKNKENFYDYICDTDSVIDDQCSEAQDVIDLIENEYSALKDWLISEANKNIVILTPNDALDRIKELKKNTNDLDTSIYTQFQEFLENNKNGIEVEDLSINNDFLKFVSNNYLINLIGSTTTSSNEICLGETLESKDIGFDYPINLTIIDEVSKSSTPELLSRTVLSNKFIICGDYKQLPPNEEIDNVYLEKIFDSSSLEKNRLDKFKKTLSSTNDKEGFCNKINSKMKQPIFKKQIEIIKNSNSMNNTGCKIYDFLNIQYRFNSDIMSLVNLFYDEKEKLENGNKNNKNIKEYKIKDSFRFENVNFINTSRISEKYCFEKFGDADWKVSQNSSIKLEFKDECLKNINGIDLNNGTFNLYNLLTIENLLLKVFKKDNGYSDLIGKIGIIALTRNQAKLHRQNIQKNNELKKLKIKCDTIDNFQGREKEIIIIDLVRGENNIVLDKGMKTSSTKLKTRNISFLGEDERMNVAASRAKNQLFLVGSYDYFLNDSSFENSLLKKYVIHFRDGRSNSKIIDGADLW
ncbi:AAA domain-containing protein [Mycoplasmopsis lipofaciens]|uniref:AAA domain-containing protein n=1 Tax=Mycoplasmopsis lipofaciens TaxID=114884 RepID=UPI00047F26EC|nr:AAA domain-containing protein [Mycoplasmopsis lipofaciens]